MVQNVSFKYTKDGVSIGQSTWKEPVCSLGAGYILHRQFQQWKPLSFLLPVSADFYQGGDDFQA